VAVEQALLLAVFIGGSGVMLLDIVEIMVMYVLQINQKPSIRRGRALKRAANTC
jgi:hypothetical protein